MLDVLTLKPVRGMLLVKPNPRKEITDGGIITLDPTKTKDKIGVESGIVIRVGMVPRNKRTGKTFKWDLKYGDTVFYQWTAGTEVKTRQGPYLLLLHNELLLLLSTD